MRRLLFIFGIVFFMVGCQTAPVRYEAQNEGYWQAKALVRDKKAGQYAVVNIDINAIKNEKLRMDITAALGHPVAVVLVDTKTVNYVLFEQKQFYKGSGGAQSLKSLIKVPLDPHIMNNLMFDLPIEEKSWVCTRDKKDYLAECRSEAEGLDIKWSDRKLQRKRITVEHALGSVQINVTEYKSKVETRDHLFELNPPKSFTPIR